MTLTEQPHQKRPSLLQKQSRSSESGSYMPGGNGCIKSQLSGCGSLTGQLPLPKKARRTLSPGGQVFLCVIGSLLSFSICLWLSIFSTDDSWRRLVFAGGAALCAVMFALLAVTSMRRVVNPSCNAVPTMIRRSTIQKSQKKSASAAPILRSLDSNDTAVIIVDETMPPKTFTTIIAANTTMTTVVEDSPFTNNSTTIVAVDSSSN